jgi:hypothetical protein
MEIYQDPYSPFSTDHDSKSDHSDLVHFGWPKYDVKRLLPRGKAHLIPVEILSEIFLYATHNSPRSQTNLMLVCRRWHAIMLSTPGIHSRLRIQKWTRKQDVERFGKRWLLYVIIDVDYVTEEAAENFQAAFMAATQARWRSLEFLFSDPDLFLYLGQPPHLHVFHSLTTLKVRLPRKMDCSVDILPHLQRLENFHAYYLHLQVYPPDVHLPLIQTLHVLHLECTSIQWLAGQVFPVLGQCIIIFPPHIEAFELVNMPSCSFLKYDSNNIWPLGQFSLPSLAKLKIKCGQWSILMGTLQVAALYPMFLTAHSMTRLHVQVRCSERLLSYMLRLVPGLKELWLGLASPHALNEAFFHKFAVGGPRSSARVGSANQTIAPLCGKLKRLHLHYERWLRDSEKKAPFPAFGDIVASRQPEKRYGFSLCLSSNDEPKGRVWKVHEPVESFDLNLREGEIYIGFSGPHGIVPLSTASKFNIFDFPFFRELDHITAHGTWYLPIDVFFSFHNLGEVRIQSAYLKIPPSTWVPSNLPLVHTLRVLLVYSIPPSLLAGQIFHKLERFMECSNDIAHDLGQSPLTDMPVCTRLAVDLSRLATLKLPNVRELSVCFDGDEPNIIWDEHVAVNTNLSGLRLLHLCCGFLDVKWPTRTDLIQILTSLPALETLIIDEAYIVNQYVDFFKAFVPIGAQEATGPKQSSGGDHISGVLCPHLQSLQIEDIDPTEQPELMSVFKDVDTLRAVVGCPLKSFTMYKDRRKWELTKRNGSFTIEEVVPARRFVLQI